MNLFLLIAAVLIILTAIFIFYVLKKNRKSRSQKAAEKLDKSSGTFDRNAAEALKILEGIKDKSAADHMRIAEIYQYNIAEGGNKAVNNTVKNKIMDSYRDALKAAERELAARGKTTAKVDRIIRRIDAAALDEDVQTQAAILNDIAANIKNKEKKISLHTAKGGNKQETINNYIAEEKKVAEDAQNVHDTAVMDSMKSTYEIIRQTASSPDCVQEILTYIEGKKIAAKGNIISVLDVARSNHNIQKYNCGELDVLNAVWSRTKLPANAANAELMREAVVKALEESRGVCIVGRVNRYMGALVLLDYDPAVGVSNTIEGYKNEILGKAAEILNKEIEIAANAEDEDMRKVGQSYKGAAVNCTQAAEYLFKETVAEKIKNMIMEYDGRLPPRDLLKIESDCMVAISL